MYYYMNVTWISTFILFDKANSLVSRSPSRSLFSIVTLTEYSDVTNDIYGHYPKIRCARQVESYALSDIQVQINS